MFIASLGLILLSGYLIGQIFEKIKIPKIVGMIIIGIILGPSILNIIDNDLINYSPIIRQIALIIILTRAGLSIDLKGLKQIGRPAVLLCFIPATFEIIAVLIFGPLFLNITKLESLLLGTVLAAVSPAVIIPRMIKLKEEGFGKEKMVPELIMAAASVDDIYVIILFYSFLELLQGRSLNTWMFVQIPLSIILGICFGIVIGYLITLLFKKIKLKINIKVLIVLGISFLMIGLESLLKEFISISALLSIISFSAVILIKDKNDAEEIENTYKGLWIFFEIFLFVLVGISVDLNFAFSAGFMPVILLLIALLIRTVGVFISLLFTEFSNKEKIFIMISYIPKATVQASIGGIALSLGLSSGSTILTIAVLSILITAPIGAILIDYSYKKLLDRDIENNLNDKQGEKILE